MSRSPRRANALISCSGVRRGERLIKRYSTQCMLRLSVLAKLAEPEE